MKMQIAIFIININGDNKILYGKNKNIFSILMISNIMILNMDIYNFQAIKANLKNAIVEIINAYVMIKLYFLII